MAKAFNLKPLEDRIVVKASEEESTTSSGIVIPGQACREAARTSANSGDATGRHGSV